MGRDEKISTHFLCFAITSSNYTQNTIERLADLSEN